MKMDNKFILRIIKENQQQKIWRNETKVEGKGAGKVEIVWKEAKEHSWSAWMVVLQNIYPSLPVCVS